MIERIPKRLLVMSGSILAGLALVYVAYSRPWYFTSQTNLTALVALEILLIAIWLYHRFFFVIVLLSFLFAGINLPGGGGAWTSARWMVLGVGAFVGLLVVLRHHPVPFRSFHVLAICTL